MPTDKDLVGGGQAFPGPCDATRNGSPIYSVYGGGMTMRDYFAAKAMQGFAADPRICWTNGISDMAICAYQWADAMLKARTA